MSMLFVNLKIALLAAVHPMLSVPCSMGRRQYQDEDVRDVCPGCGRPAEVLWHLAFVTLLHYARGLVDRQAAGAVRTWMDTKEL
jgi:hypothetical protein